MLTALRTGIVAYFTEVWEFRYFWASMVRAELQRRYRRSVFGLGWSLLHPVAMTLVLTLVYSNLFGQDFFAFAPMLLLGVSFWGFCSGTVLQGCSSIVQAESYIRQQPIPLVIFPLRSVLTLGFHYAITLALALGLTWTFHGFGNLTVLWVLPPTLVLMFVLAWAVCVLFSFAHVYFPDTQHLAEVVLQVLMFLTPIIYPPELLENRGLGFLLWANPVAVLLRLIREPILLGTIPPLEVYAMAALSVCLITTLAMWVVARWERRLIFSL